MILIHTHIHTHITKRKHKTARSRKKCKTITNTNRNFPGWILDKQDLYDVCYFDVFCSFWSIFGAWLFFKPSLCVYWLKYLIWQVSILMNYVYICMISNSWLASRLCVWNVDHDFYFMTWIQTLYSSWFFSFRVIVIVISMM